jgi:hypothetical protein
LVCARDPPVDQLTSRTCGLLRLGVEQSDYVHEFVGKRMQVPSPAQSAKVGWLVL